MFEKEKEKEVQKFEYEDGYDTRYRDRYDQYDRNTKKKSGKSWILIALVFSILGGIIGSAITNVLLTDNISKNSEPPVESKAVTIKTKGDVNVATAVAEKAIPSVVGITVKGETQSFFGPVQTQGTGSGIILNEEGYILTNAHVVKMNGQVVNEITVIVEDEHIFTGKPLWVETGADIAVIKIEPGDKKLTPATLGDSSTTQIGEVAIAIGNPIDMAFQHSVSQGIISGLDRYIGRVNGGGYMVGLIQTDASINGGNSGGPLLNEKGEVIGINTVKVTTAEGMGFAIPIDFVKPMIKQILETGEYKPMSLGVLSVDLAGAERYFGQQFDVDEGVFILKVYENSPAKAAGMEMGDVIVKIGDDEITGTMSMQTVMYKYSSGDTVKIKVLRNGQEEELDLTFSDYSVSSDPEAQRDMQE
ncbi:MAG: S1C family serine protease [Peptoniphilus sp.]|nr:S1C family serine protease [Peptoniphilus sp.]